MNKSEDVDGFVKWFDAFSPEFIAEKNKEEHEKTVKQYEEFSEKYDNGICYLCNSSFKTFSSQKLVCTTFLNQKDSRKNIFVLFMRNILSTKYNLICVGLQIKKDLLEISII